MTTEQRKVARPKLRLVRDNSVLQLKVTLLHVRPPIWRRLLVRDSATLADLHQALQVVMGWTGTHLHQFIVDGATYVPPHPEILGEDEQHAVLHKVLGLRRKKFLYEYDFGDGWVHEVVLEKALAYDPALSYPRCVAGERAAPPEDCGGPPSYQELLAVAQDVGSQFGGSLDFIHPGFDPERFDLAAINAALKALALGG